MRACLPGRSVGVWGERAGFRSGVRAIRRCRGRRRPTQGGIDAVDDDRFDAIVKHLGFTASRRRALRLTGGGALAALLGRSGLDGAEAARRCPGSRKKCGERCCREGLICRGGRCAQPKPPVSGCPEGTEACGVECRQPCALGSGRNPNTCECCVRGGFDCPSGDGCCSGNCDNFRCRSKPSGGQCSFNLQCDSFSQCANGQCL